MAGMRSTCRRVNRLKSKFDWSIAKDFDPVEGAKFSARLRALVMDGGRRRVPPVTRRRKDD